MPAQSSTDTTTRSTASATTDPTSYLHQEYNQWQTRFEQQPKLAQHYLESQAAQLAQALVQRTAQIRFSLPDQVLLESGQTAPVPPEFRDQMAGGLMDRLTRSDALATLRQRLAELEQSPNQALAFSAGLIRHITALHLVHQMLPAGRSVVYGLIEGEEIPTLPTAPTEPGSAITTATDAIAEEGAPDLNRGELQVPFVPAARQFYMPQWVAFDQNSNLLVNSINDAEAHIAAMQRFIAILHMAVSLAPYVVADETYQQKRYGLLGQLVNQGRALARYQTGEIVAAIKRRAAAQDLNRGLSLSLPYFDDQVLEMRTRNFEVIPAGRIMFVPAFVVRAAREEQAKAAQDTRLSLSTRKYLLQALKTLEASFESLAK